MNNYVSIIDFPLYEINKLGVVRTVKGQKLIKPYKGIVKLMLDGKRKGRKVEQLVQSAFYPELGNARCRLQFIKGVGYIIDKTTVNEDTLLLKKLVKKECNYKIEASKNYNDELRFKFVGLLSYDKDVKCLLVNEENDTVEDYTDIDEARKNVMNGDELYYMSVFSGLDGVEYNSELLERILMTKYWYIKHKVMEEDMEDVDLEDLYNKYFTYDFEEQFDTWDEELKAMPDTRNAEKTEDNRKVKPRNRCGVPLGPVNGVFKDSDEEADYLEEKEQKRINWSVGDLERKRKQEEYKQKEREIEEANAAYFEAKANSKLSASIKKYNKKFGTNYANIEAMCAGFRRDVAENRRERDNERRQKMRDEKKKKQDLKKIQDVLKFKEFQQSQED